MPGGQLKIEVLFKGSRGGTAMADNRRYYVVLKALEDVSRNYADKNWILDYVVSKALGTDQRSSDLGVNVNDVILPSNDVLPNESPISELVVSFAAPRTALRSIADGLTRNSEVFVGGGSDIPFAVSDHWCPSDAAYPIFADRAAAQRLLGVDSLRSHNETDGDGVNVVVVDQGLDQNGLVGNYKGGWTVNNVPPGTTPSPPPGSSRRSHGMMIAHNILQVAPKVALFDLPLAPWKISNIPGFLSVADAAFRSMRADIARYKSSGQWPGPWILVNPWGIFDTKSDLHPPHDYIRNRHHAFNRLVADVVHDGIDVVFAAGNCGQFCPDNRCGGRDKGPGHSIWGANSHPDVLTVGAVRSDGMWLGYSSQGPGQSSLDLPTGRRPNRAHDKPDLCASSQFCEHNDAFTTNTGTSASCALATGVVAALRSKWTDVTQVTPAKLKKLLVDTARRSGGPRWDGRLGHGILDAAAAYDEALLRF
jgi:Subtilase family